MEPSTARTQKMQISNSMDDDDEEDNVQPPQTTTNQKKRQRTLVLNDSTDSVFGIDDDEEESNGHAGGEPVVKPPPPKKIVEKSSAPPSKRKTTRQDAIETTTRLDPLLRVDPKFPKVPYLARALIHADDILHFSKLLLAQVTSSSVESSVHSLDETTKKKKKKEAVSGSSDMMITCISDTGEDEEGNETRGILLCSNVHNVATTLYNHSIPVNFVEPMGKKQPSIVIAGTTFLRMLSQKAKQIVAALKENPLVPIVQVTFLEAQLEICIAIPTGGVDERGTACMSVSRTQLNYISINSPTTSESKFLYEEYPAVVESSVMSSEFFQAPIICFPIHQPEAVKVYSTSLKAVSDEYSKSLLQLSIQRKDVKSQWQLHLASKVINMASTLVQALSSQDEVAERLAEAMDGANRVTSYVNASRFNAVFEDVPAKVSVVLKRARQCWYDKYNPPLVFEISSSLDSSDGTGGDDDKPPNQSAFSNRRPWRLSIAIFAADVANDFEDASSSAAPIDDTLDVPVFGHLTRITPSGDIEVNHAGTISLQGFNTRKSRDLLASELMDENDESARFGADVDIE